MCVRDLLVIMIASFTCYDTVSTYDTLNTSLFINYDATSDFCQVGMHDTPYDTSTSTSLKNAATEYYVHWIPKAGSKFDQSTVISGDSKSKSSLGTTRTAER